MCRADCVEYKKALKYYITHHIPMRFNKLSHRNREGVGVVYLGDQYINSAVCVSSGD